MQQYAASYLGPPHAIRPAYRGSLCSFWGLLPQNIGKPKIAKLSPKCAYKDEVREAERCGISHYGRLPNHTLREARAGKSSDIFYVRNLSDCVIGCTLPRDHDKTFANVIAAPTGSQSFVNLADLV